MLARKRPGRRRSSARTCIRSARCKRLRALHRQDQGLGRRHRDHRQLGRRPGAADQGRQGRRPERQVLHLLRRRRRRADRAWAPPATAACTRSAYWPLQRGAAETRKVMRRVQEEVQRRLLHRRRSTTRYKLLSTAMAKAKSTDPVKVAAALEGLKFKSFNGEVEMRKRRPPAAAAAVHRDLAEDRRQAPTLRRREHRLQLAHRQDATSRYVGEQPTSCQMKRPAAHLERLALRQERRRGPARRVRGVLPARSRIDRGILRHLRC